MEQEEIRHERKKYWLKLDKDFLKSPQMKVIKNMANGKDYIIFYLSLMLESVETVGHLRFTSLVPYNAEMLSSVTDTNIDIVKTAIKLFCELGMMQIFDDGTIFMTEVPKITGKECESAERVRKFRLKQQEENQKMLQCNINVTKCNDYIDEEKDKEEEIRNNINSDIKGIIDYLNICTNQHYKYTTTSTQKHIKQRLREGFTTEDFKIVIDRKSAEWMNTDMQKYLRPETLFGTKFESYLNIASTQKQKETIKYESSVPDWFDKEIKQDVVSDEEEQNFLEKLKKVRGE